MVEQVVTFSDLHKLVSLADESANNIFRINIEHLPMKRIELLHAKLGIKLDYKRLEKLFESSQRGLPKFIRIPSYLGHNLFTTSEPDTILTDVAFTDEDLEYKPIYDINSFKYKCLLALPVLV
jgi:hypothetical protein